MILSAAMDGSLDVTASLQNSSFHCHREETPSRHQARPRLQSLPNSMTAASHAIVYRRPVNKESSSSSERFLSAVRAVCFPVGLLRTSLRMRHCSFWIYYTRTSVPRCAPVKATFALLFLLTDNEQTIAATLDKKNLTY